MANNASNPSASKAFLLVAVVLGLLATFLAFIFIKNSSSGTGGLTIDIPVAKHDLKAMVAFDPDRDLELQPFPAKFVNLQRQSVDWKNRELVKGKKLNREVFAGQPVLNSDFAEVGKFEFKAPYVALEIPAVVGQAIPGDHVKLIAVLRNPASTNPALVDPNKPLGRGMIIGPPTGFEVLAVGGFTNITRAMITSNSSTMDFKKITLKVTEEQAADIAPFMTTSGDSSAKLAVLVLPPTPPETPATTEK